MRKMVFRMMEMRKMMRKMVLRKMAFRTMEMRTIEMRKIRDIDVFLTDRKFPLNGLDDLLVGEVRLLAA